MAACPFCKLARLGEDDDLVALRTSTTYVIPTPKQRRLNRGHTLILPNVHVTRLIDAETPILQELYSVAGRVSLVVGTPCTSGGHVHILLPVADRERTVRTRRGTLGRCRELEQDVANVLAIRPKAT